MADAEANYVIDAVLFIACHGHLFLALYDFDLCSGTWTHKHGSITLQTFSLDAALDSDDTEPAVLTGPLLKQLYDHYMTEANRWAEKLKNNASQTDGLRNSRIMLPKPLRHLKASLVSCSFSRCRSMPVVRKNSINVAK
jgi:hypothetical protein